MDFSDLLALHASAIFIKAGVFRLSLILLGVLVCREPEEQSLPALFVVIVPEGRSPSQSSAEVPLVHLLLSFSLDYCRFRHVYGEGVEGNLSRLSVGELQHARRVVDPFNIHSRESAA